MKFFDPVMELAQRTNDEERLCILVFTKISVECNSLECLTIKSERDSDRSNSHLLCLNRAWHEYQSISYE